MTSSVITSNVSKHYGRVAAVRDVSFDLKSGETIALVGHNGAGKTTLIKLMLGLIRPTSGSVTMLGGDPARGDFHVRQSVGYLPESVSFHMALTGRETLTFYARLKRVEFSDAELLFKRVGLSADAVDRPVRTYSKGMRQRLGLAQALLGTPQVLLLDEPTSGLDPALRQNFYDIISALRADGTTVLLSSHALTELENRADRVIIVDRGVKIADGTLDELRHIASLPTRVMIKLSDMEAAPQWSGDWCRQSGGGWEIGVDAADKIDLLKSLTAEPSLLESLTLAEPTLDELYAHFLGRQAAE
ncbi:ABC transporter ATP-binding protein [Rhizobium wenxiniae]|uniref:Cu-processing system ATP-binding protein n=1 Tax=Rhizobium wenxiniae TaxID=1737357 RepID=A0A7W9YCD4_9HYPH|nr:ABC transporter ATP-binding protein [Rhizobium wenxiniae]MBB6165817.1 Cu-processing system ATP-binding protein [Rhizobium wenxiniae]GGG19287.1 ABC transporter ATP-binding protein [Rhizobium wenxiniae]